VPQLASTAVEATELKGLIETTSSPAVSIYLPTVRVTAQPEQNAVLLKNALGGIDERLVARGMSRSEVVRLLEPLRSLLGDRDFWNHQLEGLALLRAPDTFERFRLPFSVRPRVIVADSPYVVPLFRPLAHGSSFYVLALSQGAVRLIECTAQGASEVDTSEFDIPHSLAEALRYDDLQKPESMHHPSTGPGRAQPAHATPRQGRGDKAFHGHGDDGEDHKGQVRRYVHAVDVGVSRHLSSRGAPLVLAAVDYVRAMYRETTDYPAVLSNGIDGNPDHLRPKQLLEAARPIMEAHFEKQMSELKDRYETALAHDGAACELEQVLWAAYDGRVDTLFVRDGAEDWAKVDAEGRSLERSDGPASGTEELHDLTARRSLINGGRVLALDDEAMPCDGAIAAIYRY
jgi:Bacterial archaeo-eukaryotic release factor family 3